MHQDSTVNLTIAKKIPAMFRNFQNYDSHLLFQEVRKYDFKTNVMPK